MAMFLARTVRSLPLVILLAVLALVVYFVVVYHSSPNRAKEILIKLFTVIGIALSLFFGLFSVYAYAEKNYTALDFMLGFLIISLITLLITRISRAVFLHHNPKYRKKAKKTTKGRRLR